MVVLRFSLKSQTLGEIALAVSRRILLDSFEDTWPVTTLKINFSSCFCRTEAGSGGAVRKLGPGTPS